MCVWDVLAEAGEHVFFSFLLQVCVLRAMCKHVVEWDRLTDPLGCEIFQPDGQAGKSRTAGKHLEPFNTFHGHSDAVADVAWSSHKVRARTEGGLRMRVWCDTGCWAGRGGVFEEKGPCVGSGNDSLNAWFVGGDLTVLVMTGECVLLSGRRQEVVDLGFAVRHEMLLVTRHL